MTETALIETDRLQLTPLRVSDAAQMAVVLGDRALYEFTGGEPPTVAELEARYTAQIAGPSEGDDTWHNWIVRLAASGVPVGYVQASVAGVVADVAWVIGTASQGQGVAGEAAIAMCAWLVSNGVDRITAHIHPAHASSAAVARACGLGPTNLLDDDSDDDGEVVWERLVGDGRR